MQFDLSKWYVRDRGRQQEQEIKGYISPPTNTQGVMTKTLAPENTSRLGREVNWSSKGDTLIITKSNSGNIIVNAFKDAVRHYFDKSIDCIIATAALFHFYLILIILILQM